MKTFQIKSLQKSLSGASPVSFFKDYTGAMPHLGITYLQVTERLRIQTHPRTLNTLCDLFILEAMFL